MASSGSNTSSSSIVTGVSSMRRQGTPGGVTLAKKRRAAAAAKSTKVNCVLLWLFSVQRYTVNMYTEECVSSYEKRVFLLLDLFGESFGTDVS